MFRIKHLMDRIEAEDGLRVWVEPIGITRDLREWCSVHKVFSHLGPPVGLWEWFDEHPDGYGYFRSTYHEWLGAERNQQAIQEIIGLARGQGMTLLHQGIDPAQNTATALYEYLSVLSRQFPE